MLEEHSNWFLSVTKKSCWWFASHFGIQSGHFHGSHVQSGISHHQQAPHHGSHVQSSISHHQQALHRSNSRISLIRRYSTIHILQWHNGKAKTPNLNWRPKAWLTSQEIDAQKETGGSSNNGKVYIPTFLSSRVNLKSCPPYEVGFGTAIRWFARAILQPAFP